MYTDPVRQYNRTTVGKLTVVDRDNTRQRLTTLSPGGLALLDLRTELGISTIKYMRDAIYKESETRKLMIMNAKYSQIEWPR